MMATFFTTKHRYGLAEIPHIIFPPKFLPAQNFFPPKIFSMELNSKFVCSWIKNGILEHSSLAQIWKEYPKHVHSSLLYLLTKFEICYSLKEKEKNNLLDSISEDNFGISSPIKITVFNLFFYNF